MAGRGAAGVMNSGLLRAASGALTVHEERMEVQGLQRGCSGAAETGNGDLGQLAAVGAFGEHGFEDEPAYMEERQGDSRQRGTFGNLGHNERTDMLASRVVDPDNVPPKVEKARPSRAPTVYCVQFFPAGDL